MKKLYLSSFSICILFLGLLGCTMPGVLNQNRPNTDFMDRWIGHHISGIIRRVGPATQITEDGAGGRIYIWVEHHQRTVHNPYFVVPPKQHTSNHNHTLNGPQETTTRGTMRWDPIFGRWEYESKTKPTPRIPDISRTVREADRTEPQPQLRFKKVTENYTGRVMFYTRSDGKIYHWLIITPNTHYAYSNWKNTQKDVSDYNHQKHAKSDYNHQKHAKSDYNHQKHAKKEKNQNLVDKFKNYEITLPLLPKDTHDAKNRENTKEGENQNLVDEIRKYDSMIYLFPDDANAYFNRGIAKYKLGQISEAKQDLHRALWLATQQDKVNLKNSIEKTLRYLQ